jgi:hypothetical protein
MRYLLIGQRTGRPETDHDPYFRDAILGQVRCTGRVVIAERRVFVTVT